MELQFCLTFKVEQRYTLEEGIFRIFLFLSFLGTPINELTVCTHLDSEHKYSGDLKSDHFKSRLFEGWISNGWALAMAFAIVPTI